MHPTKTHELDNTPNTGDSGAGCPEMTCVFPPSRSARLKHTPYSSAGALAVRCTVGLRKAGRGCPTELHEPEAKGKIGNTDHVLNFDLSSILKFFALVLIFKNSALK